MNIDWHPLVQWLQKPFLALAVTLMSGPLLFINGALTLFGLEAHRQWVAVIFLCSIVVVMAQILSIAWTSFKNFRDNWIANNAYRQRLHQLTADEKAILRRYIERNTRSQYLEVFSGVVAALCKDGIP